MDLTFTAPYEEVPRSDGGVFVAHVEELPGAITQGETLDEAREDLRDAIELLLEANRELTGIPHGPKNLLRENPGHGLRL